MSRLIARIMLSILMWPLAALVYLVTYVVCLRILGRGVFNYAWRSWALMLAGCVSWAFAACYWVLLWRGAVQWTGARRGLTVRAAAGAVVLGFLVYAALATLIGEEFGWLIGTILAPALWLVGTVFIWRESAAERGARVAADGREAVVCPTCGYNLTGLRETRCPECGAQFTIDGLLAAQPGRAVAAAELEG